MLVGMARATPMAADDRRRAIVDAALPLLREHGRDTTTKQIADAAGIAEGTIFRVFASKDEIVEAAIQVAFDPHEFLAEIDGIDLSAPLRERLVELTTLMQRRFVEIFTLMTALALPKPPQAARGHETADWREMVRGRLLRVFEPDLDAFRLPIDEVVRVLRLLTFSGSHPHITDQQLMTPDEIVDVVLNGTLTKDS